jgi:hypothetical protein
MMAMIATMLMIFLIESGIGIYMLTSHKITPTIANVTMIVMRDIYFLWLFGNFHTPQDYSYNNTR